MHQPWLSADTAGLVVGIVGGGIVVLCALFGSLSRWLARHGRGWQVVSGGFAVLVTVGLSAIALGIYGHDDGQPPYLWCPLLGLGAAVIGALTLGLPGVVLRYRRARQQRELQSLADRLIRGTSSRSLARADTSRRWR
jgi:hypothetical protein